MSTEFNYVARLDTTQIMSGIAEIRSQVGMAFASPTGFQSPAMSLGGGGFSGMNNVSSAIGSQFQQMFAGMGQSQGMFGGTHTNPAMAYSPHYGMNQAQTSLEQEWQIHRGGLAAAAGTRPPGVSASEYALGVESNFINRQLDANHAAKMAAQSAFYAGVGGLGAGEAASMIAAPIGAFAGGKVASRLFGGGAAGAGKMLGGLAASWFAFDLANDYVGGKVTEHFAEIEQIQGVTRELGELAGAGRGLKRTERVELGIAARQASRDLGMDVQEMGDILALGRQAGMLPTATDPGKAREQFRDFARTIEEGAQVLGTSLAGATQVIKAAISQGMSGQEGVIRAAGAGGADVWLAQQSRMSAFGAAGASVGMSMGFTPGQGSAMFTGSLGAGAGMSGDEMRIMGGRYGAAQFLGTTQMAMASSPLGNMQMMAAMGGGLPGAGLLDLPGAAMEGLMAGGGDFMSNAGRFMVHQNEYRRGIGASGIRTMARQQISMGGELISQFMPDLSANEAERMYAMSMGMNPDQAKLLVGGGRGGGGGSGIGGGMGAEAQMRAIDAMQMSRLQGSDSASSGIRGQRGFTLSGGLEGAIAGGVIGGVPGALIGGGLGLAASNLGALGDLASNLFGDGPGVFASAEEKANYNERQMAAEYEHRIAEARGSQGYIDIDVGAGSRFLKADLGSARLTLGGVSPLAAQMTETSMVAMGLRPVGAGAGTIQVGGKYYSAVDVQKLASGKLWPGELSEKQRMGTASAAVEVAYGRGLNKEALTKDIARFGALYETVRTGHTKPGLKERLLEGVGLTRYVDDPVKGAEELLARARGFIEKIDEGGASAGLRERMLQKLDGIGGLQDPEVISYLEKVTGQELPSLEGGFMAGRAGAAAAKFTVDTTRGNEAAYLRAVYGPSEEGGSNRIRYQGNPFVEDEGILRSIGDQTPQASADRYFQQLTYDPYYVMGKAASFQGKDREAKRLMRQAQINVQTSDPAAFRYLDVQEIDPTEMHLRPGAEKTSADVRRAATAASSMLPGYAGGAMLAAVESQLQKDVLSKTNLKTQFKDEEAAIGDLKPPVKKKGPGTLQRAVGFGQQESAMSSIQRSLQHVERTLRALDKRVSGSGAQPQSSGDGQTTTVVPS